MTPWLLMAIFVLVWLIGYVMGYYEGKRMGYLKRLREELDERMKNFGEEHGID